MLRTVITLALIVFVASSSGGALANCGHCGSQAPAPSAPEASAAPGHPVEHKHYVCDKCAVTKEEPGKCEKCGEPLKEKAVEPPVGSPAPEASPAPAAPGK